MSASLPLQQIGEQVFGREVLQPLLTQCGDDPVDRLPVRIRVAADFDVVGIALADPRQLVELDLAEAARFPHFFESHTLRYEAYAKSSDLSTDHYAESPLSANLSATCCMETIYLDPTYRAAQSTGVNDYGTELTTRLKRLGWTHDDLIERGYVSQSTISRIVANKRVRVVTKKLIEKALADAERDLLGPGGKGRSRAKGLHGVSHAPPPGYVLLRSSAIRELRDISAQLVEILTSVDQSDHGTGTATTPPNPSTRPHKPAAGGRNRKAAH